MGGTEEGHRAVRVEELDAERVEEWTDGSRIEERAGGSHEDEGVVPGRMGNRGRCRRSGGDVSVGRI